MAAFPRSNCGDEINAKTLLMICLQLIILINGVAAIPNEELDEMLPVLRFRGYNRFANAIETSDLSLDFLSVETLTLFAPTDDSLYTLDMALPGDSYLSVLRSHSVPRRLSVSDLRLLPPSAVLPTLLPNHTLSVAVRGTRAVNLEVNGMPLEAPGLYYSSHVVIHGLAGAISFWSDVVTSPARAPSPRARMNRFTSLLPPTSPPIRATLVQAPAVVTYAGPDAVLPHYDAQVTQAAHGDHLHQPPRGATAPPPPDTSNAVRRMMISAILG